MSKLEDILDRTSDKNGTLMVAKFHPEVNQFDWTPLSDTIEKLILQERIDTMQEAANNLLDSRDCTTCYDNICRFRDKITQLKEEKKWQTVIQVS